MSTINNDETTAVVEESGSDESTNEVVVIVHLDYHHHQIGSKLLTNFYRTINKLNSNIITRDNIAISNEIIYHTKHNSKSTSPPSPPQLLYRGTRDGFKAIDFHSRCDHQGPTLTIIKSSEPYNQIFGGFTTQSWESSNGKYISDDSAFLFKIDDENNQFRKFNIKQDKKQNAIFDYMHYLPRFGGGHDICISNDCNLNDDSCSNFGQTYELPPSNNDGEFKYGSEKANNYLAGSYEFTVSEIEVFKISIQ